MKKQILILAAILSFLPLELPAKNQPQPSYDIRFLKAKLIEAINQREVLVVFEVTAADKKNFPPVLTNTVKYGLGNGPVKTVLIGRGTNVRARMYKNNIQEKSTLVYGYIKDMIDIKSGKDLMILAFYVRVSPDDEFDTMSFAYALAEKRNPKLKQEKKFEFQVEL
jgi:hypothetical protein